MNVSLIAWLLDHGADVSSRGGRDDTTALDVAAQSSGDRSEDRRGSPEEFIRAARLLIERGAELTARAAVGLGNTEWLRQRHAAGALSNPIDESGGLLRIAVDHRRTAILEMLLDFGFDPDERTRFRDVSGDQVVFTWGMPLWACAASGQHDMAELLLSRGADPNADVYASGTPLDQAFGRNDSRMVEILMRHGAIPDASTAGLYRQFELAQKFLSGEAACRVEGEQTLEERLLWGAACGGDPRIVALALARVDWRRDDPRWFGILEQPLRVWNHGAGFWARADWDRTTYQTCFRMILERCDPNIRGRMFDETPFGLTILHSIAGSREHVTAAERVAFATMLLDAGARLDLRDEVLASTPLGWACRWGRRELVTLYLARGADPVEAAAEPWATPLAWARKKRHAEIERELLNAASRPR